VIVDSGVCVCVVVIGILASVEGLGVRGVGGNES
jgi:hypothetical protein